MEKNTIYLQRFEDTIKEIARSKDLSDGEVREMIDKFFKSFKSKVTDSRMPTIKITNLGTFKPSLSRIEYQIERFRNMIKHGHRTNNSEKVLINKINHLLEIRQRLICEANGEATWKEWRNKQLDIDAKK